MLERFWFGCGGCHGAASCPVVAEMENAVKPTRSGVACLPLQLTAVTVFLLPLACAIGGGFLCSRLWADGTPASVGYWQTAGVLAGLAAGVGLAKLLLRWMYRIWVYLGRGGE
jgi:hypothetical protein